MKNTKSILSMITKQPQFNSLMQHSCYQKFMATLPPRFKQAIAFIYIKDNTLFLVVFNSKFHTPKDEDRADTVPYYSELSSGEFWMEIDDEKIRAKFQRSKELIERNHDRDDDRVC